MMYEQFNARAEGVSAEVSRFATRDAAVDYLVDFLRKEGIVDTPEAAALWANRPFLDGMDRSALQKVLGLKFEVTRELASKARFGISQMEWALADTGSLAQNSTAIEQRLVSSLSTIHIALVPTSGILPDMPSLLGSTPKMCLSGHDYRIEPDSGHRAGADNRCAWAGEADYYICR
jgi:L-lactate dehydrogenase complex protein LldG